MPWVSVLWGFVFRTVFQPVITELWMMYIECLPLPRTGSSITVSWRPATAYLRKWQSECWYSKTCSKDHLYIQWNLSWETTCLERPDIGRRSYISMWLNLSPKTICLERPHLYGPWDSLSRLVLLWLCIQTCSKHHVTCINNSPVDKTTFPGSQGFTLKVKTKKNNILLSLCIRIICVLKEHTLLVSEGLCVYGFHCSMKTWLILTTSCSIAFAKSKATCFHEEIFFFFV